MNMIISFHSYKGGTGKTNIVGNLATHLTNNGKKVMIIDLDTAGPGIHSLLDVHYSNSLTSYLNKECDVDDICYDLGNGLYAIPCKATEEDMTTYCENVAETKRFMEELIGHHITAHDLDYVLLDCSPGINKSSLLALGVSDMPIIVTTVDKQDIGGTYVLSAIAQKMKKQLYVLFNKIPMQKHDAISHLLDEFSEKMNLSIIGAIHYDSDMLDLWSRKIMVNYKPSSEFSKKIAELAERIETYADE